MLIDTSRTVTIAAAIQEGTRRSRKWLRKMVLGVLVAAAVVLFWLELRTSWLQARFFHAVASRATYAVAPGPTADFRHPNSGPYDIRLGHSYLSQFTNGLTERGFRIESQARQSPTLQRLLAAGVAPPYPAKSQAGLLIHDRHGRLLYDARVPARVYPDFDAIPEVVAHSLLFIENRELLEDRLPYKNPAVEWDRLANAALGAGLRQVGLKGDVSGGSTLATQLAKLRHSPDGVTRSAGDKLRQMTAASLAAYADGRETAGARRRIVTDYLNSISTAAAPGYGEVIGLGDALWVWYGADFEHVNRVLRDVRSPAGSSLDEQAVALRQVLSLLLAVRRPSAYLARDPESLMRRTDAYLRLLGGAGVIPQALCERALAVRPPLRRAVDSPPAWPFAERKATDAARAELLQMLGLERVYDLDRLDLTVETTLDGELQRRITDFLGRITDPEYVARAGLRQDRLLADGDPTRVVYSVTLYERGAVANLLRVQADNLNQPLNINEQTKLELGSTAKLRTLVSYLDAVADLHARLMGQSPGNQALVPQPDDRLTLWAVEFLRANPGASLETTLNAALDRRYSASPHESFFTGGGMHRFSNFASTDNGRVMSVREAFQNSVNLVFVRLMRDLVRYHVYQAPGVTADLLAQPNHPQRREYLERFARREGRQFLSRFYERYRGLDASEALNVLVERMRTRSPVRLAAVYRLIRPDDRLDAFSAYLSANLPGAQLSRPRVERLYEDYGPAKLDLADRGYLAGVHPLELWLLSYLAAHPQASLGEVFTASDPHCVEAYKWLFSSRSRRAQDRAIRILLEVDAFERIHQNWQRYGYPFGWLVPSLATALGSSGDTPAALAELMGIIANDGVWRPATRFDRLHFASGTPYETNLARVDAPGKRVMPVEMARLLRQELGGVVENGTAVRARNAIRLSDGTAVFAGGKTGTGENRHQMFGPGGRVSGSRMLNRTATFVFLVGDRYFGTITAFVPGEEAAGYGFTSSLPVQVFKDLAPAFAAVLEGRPIPSL
ncbi:MAG: transglycosylase domain-containing protein [Bryobacteraceae bacterium]